jgi:cellulose synthase/poly-beta-1,6-N-acetylglucosamine synthase-like glycosyltransferase
MFRYGIFRLKKKESSETNLPFVSVIVALKNEEKHIKQLVVSLRLIDYPKEKLEIILVNDGSTDGTSYMLSVIKSSNIKVLTNEKVGKKNALLTGIKVAKGEWIAVTDADCIVPNLWLRKLLKVRTAYTRMILGPVFIQKNQNSNTFLKSLQIIEFLGLQGATAGSAGLESPISANGANMMFHKNTFNEIQPYKDNMNINSGDDQFLMLKMLETQENSIVYCMEEHAIVYTHAVEKLDQYFNQRIRWASKGRAYKNGVIILTGLIVLSTSTLMIYTLLYGMLSVDYKMVGSIFGVKLLLDLLIIIPIARFSKSRFNIFYYLLSGMVYPTVVIITSVLGVFRK